MGNTNIDWIDYYNKLAFFELRFTFVNNQWKITFPIREKFNRKTSYEERFSFLNNHLFDRLSIEVRKSENLLFLLNLEKDVEYSLISDEYFINIKRDKNKLIINANQSKFQILEKVKNEKWQFVFKQFDRLEDKSVTFNDVKKYTNDKLQADLYIFEGYEHHADIYDSAFTDPNWTPVLLAKMILAMPNNEYELLAKNIGQFTDEETEIIAAALLQDYQFEEFINTNRIKLFGKIAAVCSLEYIEDLDDFISEFYEQNLLEWECLYFEVDGKKYTYNYKPYLFDDEDRLIYTQKQEILIQKRHEIMMKYST